MSISYFSDKTHPPKMDEVLTVVGGKRHLWDALIRFVQENYRAKCEFKYYGKAYGWMVSFRKSGKALLALYPQRNGLVAQVIVRGNQVEQALALGLGKNAARALQEAHEYAEGRWLYIPVKTKRDTEDVQGLVQIKMAPALSGTSRRQVRQG
jgi:hypothetical protein